MFFFPTEEYSDFLNEIKIPYLHEPQVFVAFRPWHQSAPAGWAGVKGSQHVAGSL